ncbi:unnamed protein product [Miscanthus lutarioriparius]|uniref:Uncharacterized protein n=1 Tax=Miscanthus lutarioriparius TaxID=422564 RepID=A0A811QNY5_9POAL|nr:unnamed protein product [Miscanthus lutarioriparius]
MVSAMAGSHAEAEAALLLRCAAGAKQLVSASSHLLFRATVLSTLTLVVLFAVHYPSLLSNSFCLSALPASGSSSSSSSPRSRHSHWSLLGSGTSSSYGWGGAV